MREQRYPVWKRYLYSPWFLAAVFGAAVILAFNVARTAYQNYQVKQAIDHLQDEVHRLESKKLETMQVLKYVRSPAFIEDRARLEFNLGAPGEKMMLVNTSSAALVRGQNPAPMVEQEHVSNPVKWWRYFFAGRS